MKNRKTLEMAQLAILIAIILIMSFTPLGYLRTPALSISLLTIPVAIGAMAIGPLAGAALGLVFGITSFYQCFGLDPFGTALLNYNPVFTFLLCIPTRVLMGWLSGITFKAVAKVDKTHTVSYFVGWLSSALYNTLLFMGMLILCFWNAPYIREINESLGNLNVMAFVVTLVGLNGLLEMPAACIVGGAIAKALNKAFKRT